MDLRSEQRRAARGTMTALIVCAAGLALAYTILPRWFHFPVDLPARLAFALSAELFVLLWVVLGVVLVALGRGRSAADIGGAALSPPSPAIAIRVAFLQNTLEQAMVTAGAHLALATLLEDAALALIVAAVALFGLGRLAFLVGYQAGRVAERSAWQPPSSRPGPDTHSRSGCCWRARSAGVGLPKPRPLWKP